MRRRRTQNDEETAIDMTPMLDIVFIMLIFFIVTTSFVKEAGVDINRPAASTGKKTDSKSLVVAITKDGAVYIDGSQIDVQAVRPLVESLRAQDPESAVMVQADDASRTGALIQVMDQIRAAGVTKISVATQKP